LSVFAFSCAASAIRNSDKQLILRLSRPCAPTTMKRQPFKTLASIVSFNTNNLWIRLDKLKEIIDKNGGFIPFP
jgi:hypothetical protein